MAQFHDNFLGMSHFKNNVNNYENN